MVDLGDTGPVPDHLLAVLEQRCTEQCSEQHTYTTGCGQCVVAAPPTGAELLRIGMRGMFTALGLDPDGEALSGTPDRWMRALTEFTGGYAQDPEEILGRTFEVSHSGEAIGVINVPFTSVCEHHLLPFSGLALIAYKPPVGGRVVGLSKLPRLLDVYARRLQTQEQLTKQVTDALEKHLVIHGAACVIGSEHGCLANRGARKPGAVMVTGSFTGIYESDMQARRDLLDLMGGPAAYR
jgi:GTP cyclohydrolase I